MADWNHGPDQLVPSTSYVTWVADQAVKLRADDKEIASDPPVSVVTVFRNVIENYPDRIAMVDSHDDVEDVYTYKRYYEAVIHVAKAFIKLGLESSHGVGIIGFNSPQWFISYLGTIFAGGVTAGLSHTSFGSSNSYLAGLAKCNVLVVENDKLLQSFFDSANDLPHLKAIIQFRGRPRDGFRKVYSWKEVMDMNLDDYDEELERRIMNIAPNKLCALISTSGTTGEPKWVMLSHDNILWTLKSFMNYIDEGVAHPTDTIVSYLNLCLMSAHVVDIYWSLLSNGGTVYFAKPDSLKGSLVETLRKARPTVLMGFPFLYDKLINYLLESEIIDVDNSKENTLLCAKKDNQPCNKYSTLAKKIAKMKEVNESILKEMICHLGLDRCRLATTAGKPCQQEVIDFFQALGIPLVQLYAMSETGCIASNLRSSFKANSVGAVIPGVQLKLQPLLDGENTEVCLFGRNVFMGYLGSEHSTLEAFDENLWFRTSDIGTLDKSGRLSLVGRLSDFIVQGDNRKVLPLPIEKRVLEEMPCLSNCVVVGEDKDYLNALLVFKTKVDQESGEPTDFLDQEALDWCRNRGINAEKLSDLANSQDQQMKKEIQKVMDSVNKRAPSNKEAIFKWKILPRGFSISGGELGPSLKLRRNTINHLYTKEINEFYEE